MGRRRETDEQIDRGGMMTAKKKTLVNNIFLIKMHLTSTGPYDSQQCSQVWFFMPPGIIKLSLLTIIHSTEKYIIIQES